MRANDIPSDQNLDFDLINKIVSGDGDALVFLLVHRCGNALKYLCNQNRASRLDLDDLVQEVSLKLIANDYKALRDFQGRNSSTGRKCGLNRYVTIIARNHIQRLNKRAMTEISCSGTQDDMKGNGYKKNVRGLCENVSPSEANPLIKNSWKKESYQIRREINFSLALSDDDGGDWVPDQNWINDQISMEAINAIMALEDSRERFVLIEYKIKGYSPKEVAAILGTTEGNVYTICSRAQKKVHNLLVSEGVSRV
ncbi:hypothetical protein DESC_90006 [Desulfosarcina cetonica]|uniref:RNA polymerase sigma factor n=1 Tax=Desulfosarcina cetonica TaxID=90730 RepID=UPI0006CFC8D4|nr:sigma-70 family RNA polymerase sigma factor [Desulfosarcina cetonica]VTR71136.1 hypothetical protein DESC_90006 [Desulfosarcina cetonica]